MKTSSPSIAIFVYCLRGGGAERVAVHLANGLVERGFHVTVITELGPETDQYQLAAGIDRVVIGDQDGAGGIMDKAWRMVRKFGRLRSYLRRAKPDVVISFMTRSNVMALSASIGLNHKLIISERNDPRYRPEPIGDRLLRSMLYRRCDLLVAQTPVLEKVCRERFKVVRTAWIPNPFLPAQNMVTGQVNATRRERPYALAMGRLHYQKGFDVLIRAYARTSARHDVDLVIAGEGEERSSLVALADDLGVGHSVKFPGHIADPYALLAGCSLFILSSRFEGFPNVLLEALSFSRPVISTQLPSGAHSMLVDEKSGLLVPIEDVDALKSAIDKVAADDAFAARLGEEGRKAIEPFGLGPVVSQWHDVIEGVVIRN